MGIFMSFIVVFTLVFSMIWKYIYVHYFQYSKYYYIYKKFDKYNNFTKLSAFCFAIFCLIIYFLLRWRIGLESVIKYDLFNQKPSNYRSSNLSAIFMLDLCSIISPLAPILIIVDWKRKIILRPVAVLCLLGGFLAILFAAPEIYTKWSVKDFFLGADEFGIKEDSPLTFTIHFWMTIIGSQVLTWSKKFTKKDFLILSIIGFVYAAYVIAITNILNIQSDATGLVKGDFYVLDISYYKFTYNDISFDTIAHPTYDQFTYILGNKVDWIWISGFAWLCFIWFALSIAGIKNLFAYFRKNDGFVSLKI